MTQSTKIRFYSATGIFLFFLLCQFSGLSEAKNKGKRLDVNAVQGVLAVQSLDGWLLTNSKGNNEIAMELVNPDGKTRRQWFYLVPSFGQPRILHHKSERAAFVNVPGTKLEYRGRAEMVKGLKKLLSGVNTLAMEYAPNSGIKSLTRVEPGIVNLVKKAGVEVRSSANLVQFTKSLWGPEGRVAHYVAIHHLSKLREEALEFIAERIWSNRPVTELDVQEYLKNGYRVRGIEGTTSVSVDDNTADPNYVAGKRKSSTIGKNSLLVIRLHAALQDSDRPIYASISWVAFVGETVPARYQKRFQLVARARDKTVSFIGNRVKSRRLVKGFEADQQARQEIGRAGLASRFSHRTGHSLDTSLEGAGANLDDYKTHDTRNLVVGSGFTVGPGVYAPGDFGVQSTVDLHVTRSGLEVTSALQKRITPLLLKYPTK